MYHILLSDRGSFKGHMSVECSIFNVPILTYNSNNRVENSVSTLFVDPLAPLIKRVDQPILRSVNTALKRAKGIIFVRLISTCQRTSPGV